MKHRKNNAVCVYCVNMCRKKTTLLAFWVILMLILAWIWLYYSSRINPAETSRFNRIGFVFETNYQIGNVLDHYGYEVSQFGNISGNEFVLGRTKVDVEKHVISSSDIVSQVNDTGDEVLSNDMINVTKKSNDEASNEKLNSEQKFIQESTDKKRKLILLWNRYMDDYFNFGEGSKPFEGCWAKGQNCETTNDKSLLSESDAVIVHVRNISTNPTDPFPSTRPPSQRWVFFVWEPPIKMNPTHGKNPDLSYLNNVFNWTMTYRRDSDIPRLHGIVYKLPKPVPQSIVNYAEGKTKLVAWFVSNCHAFSDRLEYAKELQEHVPVDIYGKCGNLTCIGTQKCDDMLKRDYKFYLSFENSFCRDYITEKVYFMLMYSNVIPVVRGSANYSQVTPPHSVINTADFETPKHLADYLLYLNKNDTAYSEYFDWKRNYGIKRAPRESFCLLCEKLNNPKEPPKVYDLQDWWVRQSSCLEKN